MIQPMAIAYDTSIDRRHARLAIIWLAALIAIALIGVIGEYVLISHYVTTLMNELFNHLVPVDRPPHTP